MNFSILGPVEVSDGGAQMRVHGALGRALLAALLLHAGQVVSDQNLVSMLWAVPPATATAQLRQHVSALRRTLGTAAILRRGAGYVMCVEPGVLDLEQFNGRVERARAARAAGRTEEAAALFREALGLWRGAPFGGAAHDFVRRMGPALEERRLAVLEECFEAELGLSRHSDLVGEILEQLTRDPLRERLRRQLMIALYRCGRQSEALEVFRAGRALLREELGLEPGPELRRLERAIHAGDPALEPPPADRAAVRPAGRSLLPADLADFTGREEEIAIATRFLEDGPRRGVPALCVISGGPGTGKSALALRLAHLLEGAFPGGRVHLDLGRHGGDTGAALGRLLHLLGFDAAAVPPCPEERAELYRDHLCGTRTLVVLDNAADERTVRPLLPGVRGCSALVTSRGPLPGLGGADRLELGAFELPDAVELLSRVIGPARTAADPAATERVAAYCGRLPLALRIAGTRLAARPHAGVERFAARLRDERGRLDELRTADLDLRPVLDHGLDALAPPARRAFRTLGTRAAGRFCATEAAAILGETLEQAEDEIEALAGAGLVEYSGDDPGGHDTYAIPVLLRLYARELAEGPRTE